MPTVGEDFTIRVSKKTMLKLIASLCAHGRVHAGHRCYLKRENCKKGQHSTLISSTYGWVSHISLIRFIRISLSPKIGRVWKNGCLEGPLISSPSALLT